MGGWPAEAPNAVARGVARGLGTVQRSGVAGPERLVDRFVGDPHRTGHRGNPDGAGPASGSSAPGDAAHVGAFVSGSCWAPAAGDPANVERCGWGRWIGPSCDCLLLGGWCFYTPLQLFKLVRMSDSVLVKDSGSVPKLSDSSAGSKTRLCNGLLTVGSGTRAFIVPLIA
jgi:hypothetical protein